MQMWVNVLRQASVVVLEIQMLKIEISLFFNLNFAKELPYNVESTQSIDIQK